MSRNTASTAATPAYCTRGELMRGIRNSLVAEFDDEVRLVRGPVAPLEADFRMQRPGIADDDLVPAGLAKQAAVDGNLKLGSAHGFVRDRNALEQHLRAPHEIEATKRHRRRRGSFGDHDRIDRFDCRLR